jgi:hypothetical protein
MSVYESSFKKAVILNDTSYESHHGCEVVIDNIKLLLYKNNIKTVDTNPVGTDCLENSNFLKNMASSDLVIVNGEGTLHHNQPRAVELMNAVKYIRLNLNIPIVLINSTYQDNGVKTAKLMRYFDLIFVRESLSKNELNRHGIFSEVVPDMTFYDRYENIKKNSEREGIAITDSVYLDKSEALYNLALENKISYMPMLTHKKVFGNLSGIENIARIFLRVIRFFSWKCGYKYNHTIVRSFFYIKNHLNYIDKISNLKLIVVGRYHSLCFALKTFTPFEAIKSNSHKIEGLLIDIGINNEFQVKQIELISLNLNGFNDKEILKISEYVNAAPLRIENMFLSIKKLLVNYEDSL